MYDIELPQSFVSGFNEKRHQVALLVRKAESKHENENIPTGESLLEVPGHIGGIPIPPVVLSS